jgi:hypothetical protein
MSKEVRQAMIRITKIIQTAVNGMQFGERETEALFNPWGAKQASLAEKIALFVLSQVALWVIRKTLIRKRRISKAFFVWKKQAKIGRQFFLQFQSTCNG